MISRPYLIFILQVIVLCIAWLVFSGKSSVFKVGSNVKDNQILMSKNNEITASMITVDNTRVGGDNLWTSDMIKSNIDQLAVVVNKCCENSGKGGTVIDDSNTTSTTTWSSSKIFFEIKKESDAIRAAIPQLFFDVCRDTSMKTSGVITYSKILVESPNSGIDITTGIFTAPKNGVYRMTFTGMRYYFVNTTPPPAMVRMKKNGVSFAVSATSSVVVVPDPTAKPPGGETLSINCLVSLVKGDRVQVDVEQGGIFDTATENITHFTGELIIEK